MQEGGMDTGTSRFVDLPRRGLVVLAGYDGDRIVVWLRGEHDISTVAALSEMMDQAIALGDGDLIVDLSNVDFMSAATVGIIVRTRECLRLRSRSLALRSPSVRSRRVLDLCGVATSLPDDAGPPEP